MFAKAGLARQTSDERVWTAISFENNVNYDHGIHPAVALAYGGGGPIGSHFAVEVHQEFDGFGRLWFLTGYEFAPSGDSSLNTTWSGAQPYDDFGHNPSIAICSTQNGPIAVLEVHESSGGQLTLRVGEIVNTTSPSTIQWTDSTVYDTRHQSEHRVLRQPRDRSPSTELERGIPRDAQYHRFVVLNGADSSAPGLASLLAARAPEMRRASNVYAATTKEA